VTTGTGAALRRIQLGNALSAFGNGFTVPFLFVYVAQVRGLGAGTAGIVLSAFAAAALVVLPFTGRAIDVRGPLPVLLVGALASAAGALGFGLGTRAPAVVAASAVMGAGVAVIQPALATLVVRCTAPGARSRAFATQFFLNNLGLGVGGLLGGLIVDTSRPMTFTLLFAVEALMFLVLAAVVARVRLPAVPESPVAVRPEGAGQAPAGGWRALLGDRAMVWLCVLAAVMFFACYGQFESGLSAFAVQVTRVSPAMLGVALAANTAVIVVAQFLVLRVVERRRRSRVIAAVGVVWALAWVAAGASGLVHGHQAVATALLVSTYAAFGLGEAMLAPTMAPLVADLAPRDRVGQYNSAFALVKQVALAVGPAFGGALAGAGAYGPYIVALVVASLAIGALAVRMGALLSAAQDRPVAAGSREVRRGGPADPAGVRTAVARPEQAPEQRPEPVAA
jgi:MFS family permease